MQFLDRKFFYFDTNFIVICPSGLIDRKVALFPVMSRCRTPNIAWIDDVQDAEVMFK